MEKELSSSDDFVKIISTSEVPVIVDFHAEWCGPCKKLGSILKEEIKNKQVLVLKVNVDDYQDIAEKYDVSGIPHVILFVKGEIKKTFTGLDQKGLKDMMDLI
jgi:thioredoxin 1